MKYIYIAVNFLLIFLLNRQVTGNNGSSEWLVSAGLMLLIAFHSYKLMVRSDEEGYEWFTYVPFALYYIIYLLAIPSLGLVPVLTAVTAGSYMAVMTKHMLLGFRHKSVTQKTMELIMMLMLLGSTVLVNGNEMVAAVYAVVMLGAVVSVHLLKRELTLKLNKPLILDVTAFGFLLLGIHVPLISLVILLAYFGILYYYDSNRWAQAYLIPFGIVAFYIIENVI